MWPERKQHKFYEKNTTSNNFSLIKQLYNLKMEGNLITEYLNEFNIITSQLASLKIILDDKIRVIVWMCSMPDRWKNLIVTMSTLTPTWTFNFYNWLIRWKL
jgi:hypothetical protein